MSNIDNLGRYGEFSRDADKYIKQLQSDAVDDAALKQHAEGLVVGVALVAVAVGCVKFSNYVVTQYKSRSEERKVSTATAKEKLKAAFKKMQNSDDPDDAVDEPGETGGQTPESGAEN
ncbi:hypothetical protein [Arthrobacter sp. ov118]|uniref:hypothetical protein n=1 Tax=Arthrobacter sp. ov118 TaxID=1761747 RepID=UPI0008F30BDC|nr:hypothetical protein [Arthrobacter sp. ov118]SFT44728.1 hypothetical protein SAMN04487915_101414 [Arthrobacter sp. ov118]